MDLSYFFDRRKRQMKRVKDMAELQNLFDRHGTDAVDILKERISNPKLSNRDRRHWRRLLKYSERQRYLFWWRSEKNSFRQKLNPGDRE